MTITLAEVFNGMSVYVKNIDTTGVVTIDPGTMNIDQGLGVTSTSDITLSAGESIHLLFLTDTWWNFSE